MEKTPVHICYCHIPLKKLVQLVRLRYVQGVPTEELMKSMKTKEEKEYLTAVALLDVKQRDLVQMVEIESPSQLKHLLDCRSHTKEILEGHGISIKER